MTFGKAVDCRDRRRLRRLHHRSSRQLESVQGVHRSAAAEDGPHAQVPDATPGEGAAGYATPVSPSFSTAIFEHRGVCQDTDDPHLEVWRTIGDVSRTRTGIWHETYLVRAGDYEAVYSNMPPHGLGKAAKLVSVADSVGARQRLKATRI